MTALSIENLTFSYGRRAPRVLDIAHFELANGETVFLKGASGSGKSTLLGLISGVLANKNGKISVLNQPISTLSASKRDAFRADRMGVIFQMFNLLPYLPVSANVTLPCEFSKVRAQKAADHGGAAEEGRRLLTRLGLDPDQVWSKRTSELSVGQQQRVAAARALIGQPGLILADEPTSALDSNTRNTFIELLMEECRANDTALVFVSHDGSLAHHFDRAVDLSAINQAASEVTI